jgi:hypothetical protein
MILLRLKLSHHEDAASFANYFLWLDQATKAGAYNNRPVFVAFLMHVMEAY